MADTADELVELFGMRDLEFWIGFAACGLRNEKRLRRAVERLQAENERLRQERRPPGGRPPLADDVAERIRLELARGTPIPIIVRSLGVSRATVYRVRSGVSKPTETDADDGDG